MQRPFDQFHAILPNSGWLNTYWGGLTGPFGFIINLFLKCWVKQNRRKIVTMRNNGNTDWKYTEVREILLPEVKKEEWQMFLKKGEIIIWDLPTGLFQTISPRQCLRQCPKNPFSFRRYFQLCLIEVGQQRVKLDGRAARELFFGERVAINIHQQKFNDQESEISFNVFSFFQF